MKTRKGFTLIELMIVIAIIAIIAAIAIPNLMASRVRANEATAISAIKQIATAQVTFQAGRQGRNTDTTLGGPTGFCDNYRNLAFGRPMGDTTGKLALVSDVVANAALAANGGGTTGLVTNNGSSGTLTAYQGYLFSSSPDVTWTVDFACYGVPNLPGTSGNNAYWVGQQGTVYIQGLAKATTAPGAYATGTTPQTQPVPTGWTTL